MPTQDQYRIADDLFTQWAEAYGEGESQDLESLCNNSDTLVQIVSSKVKKFLAIHRAIATTENENGTSEDRFVGAVVGQFELTRYISEGSFGVVYEARRTTDFDQRVAIKLLAKGVYSKSARARFYRECQALANLDHTSIVTAIDAGETDSGIPYLVMDYIEGDPISVFCNTHSLPTLNRLNLVIGICEQMAHAHTKQILHRDLKPSNILVCIDGNHAEPRVIDFGVAKLLDQFESPDQHITQQSDLVGTIAYMSPEQLGLAEHAPDTRSDIYAIGVILYELISGTLPYHGPEECIGVFELRKRIENNEFVPLLTCIRNRMGDLAISDRSQSPPWLCKDATMELEWIVTKCIEVDPERRYATCNELANDLKGYIRNEPLLAGPATRSYRLRKFVARNRYGTLMAAAMVLILVSATAYALFERDKAVRSAQATERVADFQASRLSKINIAAIGYQIKEQIIKGALGNSSSSNLDNSASSEDRDRIVSVLDTVSLPDVAKAVIQECIFVPTIDEIEESFGENQGMRGRLLGIVATAQEEAGLLQESVDLHDLAFEANLAAYGRIHTKTAAALREYGNVLRTMGFLEAAEPKLVEALKVHQMLHGTLHFETIVTMNDYAVLLDDIGRADESEEMFLDALDLSIRKLGSNDKMTARIHSNYGGALVHRGRFKEAEDQQRIALDIFRRIWGNEHLDTILALNNLGNSLFAQERYTDAEPYLREALQLSRSTLGNQHVTTLLVVANAAVILEKTGSKDEAFALSSEAVQLRESILGPNHQSTVISMHNHAGYLRAQGRLEEAQALGERAVAHAAIAFGARTPHIGQFMSGLATTLRAQEDYVSAAKLYLEAHDIMIETLDEDDHRVVRNNEQLQELYRRRDLTLPNPSSSAK